MDFAPKYHFDYFTDRMTKMSSDKTVKAHISKLRDVYKGEADHIVEFGGEQMNLKDFQKEVLNKQQVANTAGNNDENQVNGGRATDKKEGIPYFSYDNQSAEKQSKPNEAQFMMLDGPDDANPIQMINTTDRKAPTQSGFQSLTQ